MQTAFLKGQRVLAKLFEFTEREGHTSIIQDTVKLAIRQSFFRINLSKQVGQTAYYEQRILLLLLHFYKYLRVLKSE